MSRLETASVTDLLTNYGQLHPHHPHKDFAKYDFFQILSIVYVSPLLLC